MAEFLPASQFRKRLYRPDVVKLLLKTGGFERALEVADASRGKSTGTTDVAKILPPEVEVARPRSGIKVKVDKLEVQAIAKSRGDHPVTSLRLLLDGRPYRGQAGVMAVATPKLGEVRQSWTVELEPGNHQIAVQADSTVSQAVSSPVEVTYTSEEADVRPDLYVLTIGVSAYPGNLKLNYAATDAQAIERAFREKSGPLFRKVETRLLTDAKATPRRSRAGLAWLKQQMTQRNVGVVFFSGHGQKDGEGNLFLLPVDVDTEDLLTSAVPEAILKQALAGLPGRVIAMLDACHAGAVGGDRRKGTSGLTDDLVRDLVTDDYGVIVMASSMGREESQEINTTAVAVHGGVDRGTLGPGGPEQGRDGVPERTGHLRDGSREGNDKGQQHPVTAKPTSIRSFPLAQAMNAERQCIASNDIFPV